MKPDLVLFEEAVRDLLAADAIAVSCDILLVVGTSAEVAPASLIPGRVLDRGGSLVEFDLGPTRLTEGGLGPRGALVAGPAEVTVPLVVDAILDAGGGTESRG